MGRRCCARRERIRIRTGDGKVAASDETLRVRQGDNVAPLTVHLHGYELEAKPTPQSTTPTRFAATMPGCFPVHGARRHPVLGHSSAVSACRSSAYCVSRCLRR